MMSSGLLIERVTLLGWTWHARLARVAVTAAWLVGLTNAFNLIDGVDGLAAGIAALAGAACGAILVARGHAPEAMLLAAFVGASLGFLVYNFEPASIFLGDSGSLLCRIPARRDGHHRLAEGRDGAGRRRADADLRAAHRRRALGTCARARLARPADGRSIARDAAAESSNPIASTSIIVCWPWAGRCGGRCSSCTASQRSCRSSPWRRARRPPRHEARAARAAIDAAARRRQRRGRVGAAGAGRRSHRVTVLSWRPVEIEPINRFFGTHLGRSDFDTIVVPRSWRLSPIICRCRRR